MTSPKLTNNAGSLLGQRQKIAESHRDGTGFHAPIQTPVTEKRGEAAHRLRHAAQPPIAPNPCAKLKLFRADSKQTCSSPRNTWAIWPAKSPTSSSRGNSSRPPTN